MFFWLIRFLQKIFPPDYGIYEKGTFPVKRKLSLSQAKSLILAGGKRERWEKETEITFSFLKNNFLEKNKNKEFFICDYGIGIGRLALPILKEYPKVKIVGVDESDSLLELARKWLPEVYFSEGRIELLKPSEFFDKYKEKTFDLLIAVYVFQHIFLEELETLIFNLYKLLKDSGRLFIINTFQNDDQKGRIVKIKDILAPYFEKEIEISPYENKEEYISWMRVAGYGNWQKMEKAKLRCQKMMGIYKKI